MRHSMTAALSALALPYRKSWSQPTQLEAVRLSRKMLAVLGPDANCLAVESNDGVIMVDGGHADWSSTLLERVAAEFSAKPISALINTHWHPEQTGSNVALGERGTQLIAHENTKLWLGSEVWVRWSDEKYPPLPAVGLPAITFYDSGSMQLAERELHYRYLLNAHTDGDICVQFPDENVVVTGGAVSNDGWPVIDWWTGGWIGGMLDAYDALLEIVDQDTRIVPSRGPVMSGADLRAQREMYLIIFDRLQTMLRNSYGIDEALAARPTAEYDAKWGDPTMFVTLAFQSLWGHLRDAYDTRLRNIP